MGSDTWYWLFVLSILLGSAWSVFREVQMYLIRREYRQMQSLLKTIANRIKLSRSSARKEFADIRALIEKTANQAQLDRIEVGLGQKHGVRINIDGDVNQAGGEVNNR